MLAYLVAILLDMLKSRPPMALVIEDTNRGTIRHFNILKMYKDNNISRTYTLLSLSSDQGTYLKKISPGNDIYIISLGVHLPVLLLIMKPTKPPKNTPIIVSMVRRLSFIKVRHFDCCFGRVILSPGVTPYLYGRQN